MRPTIFPPLRVQNTSRNGPCALLSATYRPLLQESLASSVSRALSIGLRCAEDNVRQRHRGNHKDRNHQRGRDSHDYPSSQKARATLPTALAPSVPSLLARQPPSSSLVFVCHSCLFASPACAAGAAEPRFPVHQEERARAGPPQAERLQQPDPPAGIRGGCAAHHRHRHRHRPPAANSLPLPE